MTATVLCRRQGCQEFCRGSSRRFRLLAVYKTVHLFPAIGSEQDWIPELGEPV